MQRDKEYLWDIWEAVKIINKYIAHKTKEEFLEDSLCQDAVIRRLEIIGEAARRISDETHESLSELPWSEIIAMRNRLIHRYDDIDMSIVWDTICRDIPMLISLLKKIIA